MDNFDLKKYLVENKVTTNSKMLAENEEQDFSVELLVPKIYFNVETGELAKTPAAFGGRSELKNMDITNYSDGGELIEWVFDGSLEKAKYFEKEYPGLFKIITGTPTMNENEGIKIKFLKSKQWDALQDKYEKTGTISPEEEYLKDAGIWDMEGYFDNTYPSLEAFAEFITKQDGGNAQNWLERLNKTKNMGIISIN